MRAKYLGLREQAPTKRELLTHYAERDPRRFIQYDGFTCDHWDYVIDPDENGHGELCGVTYELVSSPFDVRVLVDSNAKGADVLAHLAKIADWIKRDGIYRKL